MIHAKYYGAESQKLMFVIYCSPPSARGYTQNARIMSPGVKLWLAGRQPSPVAGCPRWWSGFKEHEASTARMRHLHNLEHQEGHHL